MGEQDDSVLFVVNHIPDQKSRTKYQHGLELCNSFDTSILCGEAVPPKIRGAAKSVRTYPESNLANVPFSFPLWLFFWSIRLRSDSVIVSPHSAYIILTFIASRVSHVKFIVDYWDDLTLPSAFYRQQTGFRNRAINLYHKISVRLATACIVRTDVLILSIHPDIVKKYDLESVRVVELTNGYQSELLDYDVPKGSGDQTRFIYIGWATALRGIDNLIRTVAEVSGEKRLDIVGPTDSTIESVAKQYNNVFLHGEMSHTKTIDLVVKADVGLCVLDTSVENYKYSYPIKLFEYAALGKAILASNTPAIQSILTHNESAILVDDYTEMRIAVERLSTDIAYRQYLAEQARMEIRPYSWSEILSQYTNEIQEAMDT